MAVVLAVVVGAFCVGMAWVSWVMLSDAMRLFEGATGWRAAYLMVGALTTSYVVVTLAPRSLAKVRRATSEYPDRISKLSVGLWSLWPDLWAVGFLALPATILWPLTATIFWRWRRRRRAAEAEAIAASDAREVDALRSAIETERGRSPDGTA